MARKRQFRFGLPIVFAGRPSVGGGGLGCQSIRFDAVARFGALGSVLPDNASPDSKNPRRIFQRGLDSCGDENMPVICPTCKIIRCADGRAPRAAEITNPLHWVGAIAVKQLVVRNSAAFSVAVQRWVDDASPIHPN